MEILFTEPFLKNQNWAYPWINILKFLVFMVCQVEDYQNILKLRCRPLSFTSYKAFLKNKRSGTSPCLIFCIIFWRKVFLLLYSINWPNFIVWFPLLREILRNMCNVTVCDVINFEINLYVSNQAVFIHGQKVSTKI